MTGTTRADQRITTAERRARVIALRRQRVSFEDIGRVLGVNKQRAHQIYVKALREIPAAEITEHRAEELVLVDDAIRDLLKLARDHDRPRTAVEAWNAIRGWSERKARLLGLDAPSRKSVEVITSDMIDAEIGWRSRSVKVAGVDLAHPGDRHQPQTIRTPGSRRLPTTWLSASCVPTCTLRSAKCRAWRPGLVNGPARPGRADSSPKRCTPRRKQPNTMR